jgi:DNA-binding CsgD family transcriptional regulator
MGRTRAGQGRMVVPRGRVVGSMTAVGRRRTPAGQARARRTAHELFEALGSSLDLQLVLERAYPPLLRLVQADYGALGVARAGAPGDFAWIVAELPRAFFDAYAEMAPHDFVRAAVAGRPNVVLRDQDMLPRRALETNMMYRRAREVGAPLEQVMAVMLQADRQGTSGLSVYRDRPRPFSERELHALEQVAPAIGQAVRNCELFRGAAAWAATLEAWLGSRDAAVVLVAPPAAEVARSQRAAALIERWFRPHERRPGGLPGALAVALAGTPPERPPPAWTRHAADGTLIVSFLPLPTGGPGSARWALLMEERPHAAALPASWRARLTPREQEVCAAVVRGWDNRCIAGELGCAEATVKRHLQRAFDKLGVPSRTALVACAFARRDR